MPKQSEAGLLRLHLAMTGERARGGAPRNDTSFFAFVFVLLALLLVSGCASVAGTPAATSACSFEQALDAAIASLADVPLRSADKASGALETEWVEVEASTRAGALQRDVNKERLKYVVEVTRDGKGAVATVLQLREEWSPMGARMRQWRGIPGNAREESAVAAGIARRLKAKGC